MRSLTLAALPLSRGYKVASTTTLILQSLATKRTFSSLPSLRPTLLSRNPNPNSNSIFRSCASPQTSFTPSPNSNSDAAAVLDLVPKTALTSHPSLAGVSAQLRFGPRTQTMERTSRLKRKRTHGFLSRLRTRNGRKTLLRRKTKGRMMLSN
ncbi:hypothetical protein F5B19DRAFT_454106 [Rostrohypoxylon terebratum]|nr:hypothetical protein F5B19DRAFT_454106 [Rostrohypoxylon terebratum]